MSKSKLQTWAEKIAVKNGFKADQLIYQGEYYTPDNVRNIIFSGTYQGKPAVLKVYDDPRTTDEPISQKNFIQNNKSKILTAPQLYAYDTVSPKKGWLIMEKLPENGQFFKSPMNNENRQRFLQIYLEYRKNFPLTPTRKLSLAEQLPAHEYHLFRISRWFQLANDREAAQVKSGKPKLLKPAEFIPRYQAGLAVIRKVFSTRKMIWCHGHFKPKEIYRVNGTNKYYLTDFAHTKMYPEGYEFGFMVWSDHLLGADWQMDYPAWKKGIWSWQTDFEPIAQTLQIQDFPTLAKASLVERVLGTILADVCAADRPEQEKIKRLQLLYQLLDALTLY